MSSMEGMDSHVYIHYTKYPHTQHPLRHIYEMIILRSSSWGPFYKNILLRRAEEHGRTILYLDTFIRERYNNL